MAIVDGVVGGIEGAAVAVLAAAAVVWLFASILRARKQDNSSGSATANSRE
jgi:hypothetical protein